MPNKLLSTQILLNPLANPIDVFHDFVIPKSYDHDSLRI